MIDRERVASLNELAGLPSRYASSAFTRDLGVSHYFLDYNSRDLEKTRGALSRLAAAGRERGLDFSRKTLLLSACGLEPDPAALLAFVHAFRDHHVFFELWNAEQEAVELFRANLRNLYFVPVTAALTLLGPAFFRMPSRPNRRVFVSLGGDDDLALLQEVIGRRDDVHFFVPDRAWRKPSFGRVERFVRMRGANVTKVPCWVSGRFGQFTLAYRLAYAACDTVMIATRAEERHRMRAGVRVADALAARKRLVMTRNTMCELLMAQHGATALVTPHDAALLSAALDQTLDRSFHVDRPLYETIRALTNDAAKLAWMVSAALSPSAARHSVFRFDQERLRLDLDRLGLLADGRPFVGSLFGVRLGQPLAIPAGGEYRVDRLWPESETRFEITLTREGDRPLVAILSTAADAPHYRRTARGHALTYRGSALTPSETSLLEQLAEQL